MPKTVRRTPAPRRRAVGALLLLVLGAGTATGCGTSSDARGTSALPTATAPTATGPAPATLTSPTVTPTVSPTSSPSAGGPSGAAPATSGPAVEAAPALITVDDFAYQVPDVVAPGTTVEVVNTDVETHTVTATGPGGFGVSVPVDGTGSFVAPDVPGSYTFVCLLHGGMEGVLVVG